jgi:hydrogenase expression/formation protein HypE
MENREEKTFRVRKCTPARLYGECRPGLTLVIAGDIALAGSDEAAEFLAGQLAERYSPPFCSGMFGQREKRGADRLIRELTARQPENRKNSPEDAAAAKKSAEGSAACKRLSGEMLFPLPPAFRKMGVRAAVPAGDGGILAALWDLSRQGGCGFAADLRRFPLSQETVEICELLDLNPYRLDAGGALILAAECAAELISGLLAAGIPSAEIGWTVRGKGCRIRSGETLSWLDFPAEDEIRKIRNRKEEV